MSIAVYLSPLPIMIAGIGWSHWSALVATAAALRAQVGGGLFFIAFFAGAGLPAWWLGYLAAGASVGRPNGGRPPRSNGTHRPSRVWAAVLAALVVIIAMPGRHRRGKLPRRRTPSLSRMLAPAGTPLGRCPVSATRPLDFMVWPCRRPWVIATITSRSTCGSPPAW
jgi:hypothetical protein